MSYNNSTYNNTAIIYNFGEFSDISNEVRNLKLIAIFTFWLSSILGVGIPLYLARRLSPEIIRNHGAFSIFRLFSAGIIISVAFIHLLSDATSTLQEISPNYPALPFAIATAGMLFVLTIEQTVLSILHTPLNKNDKLLPKYIDEIKHQIYPVYEEKDEQQIQQQPQQLHSQQQSHQHENILQVSLNKFAYSTNILIIIKAYIMQMSIAFHSVIIGIDFGTMGSYEDFPVMKTLMAALIFHQFFEGNSLGLMFCDIKKRFSSTSIIIFTLFFQCKFQ
jgi:zinc transporter 1/2/3